MRHTTETVKAQEKQTEAGVAVLRMTGWKASKTNVEESE